RRSHEAERARRSAGFSFRHLPAGTNSRSLPRSKALLDARQVSDMPRQCQGGGTPGRFDDDQIDEEGSVPVDGHDKVGLLLLADHHAGPYPGIGPTEVRLV